MVALGRCVSVPVSWLVASPRVEVISFGQRHYLSSHPLLLGNDVVRSRPAAHSTHRDRDSVDRLTAYDTVGVDSNAADSTLAQDARDAAERQWM